MERQVEDVILPLGRRNERRRHRHAARLGAGQLFTNLIDKPNLEPLREFGIRTWGQALMAWLLADPRVTVLIPATSRPQRIIENAAAGEMTIPPEMRNYVPQRSPSLPQARLLRNRLILTPMLTIKLPTPERHAPISSVKSAKPRRACSA